MAENDMRMLVWYRGALRNVAANSNLDVCARGLQIMPGLGQPFLFFASLPGVPASVDFEMYPDYVVKATDAENRATIDAMLANPPLDAILSFA